MMTGIECPVSLRSSPCNLRAERSGSSGSSSACSPPSTFETSIPLFAQMKPWRVSVISTPFLRRTITGAFTQSQFDDPRIDVIALAPGTRFGRRLYAVQANQAAFGFGDDFVLYDDDVALQEREALPAESIE